MSRATQLTLARFGIAIILIPILYQNTIGGYSAAVLLFIVAVFTDIADGYFARKHHRTSLLGAVLDPLADKILIYTLLFGLFRIGVYNPLILFPMFCRDMVVDGLRGAVHCTSGAAPSNYSGKLKFCFQSISIMFGLVYCIVPLDSGFQLFANIALLGAFVVSLPGLWMIVTGALAALEGSEQVVSAELEALRSPIGGMIDQLEVQP